MLTFETHVDHYFDVADQMIDQLRRRAERCFQRRQAERDAIKSVADLNAYRARMRENFLRAIGGLPKEKTPLQASVTGTIDRGEYVIEKVVYHSLPEFPVTASLYLPKKASKPAPAVLFVCGHALEAKAHPGYQKICIELALDGNVVLAIDPLGQGERMQFIDEQTGLQRVNWGTTEHTYAGLQYYAAGGSIARHFVWDGIRGIDYLVSRPEVDAKKIGVTGNSGGGLQTVFQMIAEDRVAAAMPVTFVMDYHSYLKSGQPQDGEQNLYAGFADGPDHDDFITAMAPKPVRLGLAAYDFFPIEGSMASLERAKKMYALFGGGAEKNLDCAIANTTHTYGNVLREAAVNFFRRALRGELETVKIAERDPETLPIDALHATKTGQVLSTFAACKNVSTLLRLELRSMPAPKEKPSVEALRANLADVLGIGANVPAGEASWQGESRQRTIWPRIIYNDKVNGYRTEKIFFFTEPDVCATAIYSHPRDESKSTGTDLLLFENGSDAIPEEKPRILSLLEQNRRVLVLDVRGVGGVKSRPINATGSKQLHNHEFRLGCDAMKMKTSTLGLRVFDVLRALDYLRTRKEAGKVKLTGCGFGAAWAFYAAALAPDIAGLTVENSLLSYRKTVEARYYDSSRFDFRNIAWGILSAGDLADLLPLIAPRPMTIVRPLSPQGLPMTSVEIEKEFTKPAETAGLIGTWRPAFK